MDSTLREQLIQIMLRIKRTTHFSSPGNLHTGEMMVLRRIGTARCSPETPMYVSGIHRDLHFSKPAISQILNSLEKKGYVMREIDADDRRKITVTLTEKGKHLCEQAQTRTDNLLDEIILRMGEEDMKQLMSLFTRLADIIEAIKAETDL